MSSIIRKLPIGVLALVAAFAVVGSASAAPHYGWPSGHWHGSGLPTPNITVPGINTTLQPQDLVPTPITVTKNSPNTAPGKIFYGPKGGVAPNQQGPEIINNAGQPYFFLPIDLPYSASDFRVQQYRGQPVLTFNVGQASGGQGHSTGYDVILNDHYQQIATVSTGNGVAEADQHEFRLTDQGTALITSYNPVHRDLSAYGGSANGLVYDGVAQEIDIRTGKVVWEWHSLDHVPLSASYSAAPTNPATPWDYFHINAVNPDSDGNILISGRATQTVYKVSHQTGDIIWQLGGKSSTFAEGPGVAFYGQHNPLPEPGKPNTYRIFDNGILPAGPASGGPARAIEVKLDLNAKTAKLVYAFPDSENLPAYAEGNTQRLSNGGLFVGWGLALVGAPPQEYGHLSEFDAAGNLVWDGHTPLGYDTYRDYRFPWVGKPLTAPTAVATRVDAGHVSVSAIWNGATEVSRWEILSGRSKGQLHPAGQFNWAGLNTKASIATSDPYVEAVALDAHGHAIGQSERVAVN